MFFIWVVIKTKSQVTRKSGEPERELTRDPLHL